MSPLNSVALVIMAKAPAKIVERAIRSASMMVSRVVLVVAPNDPLINAIDFPMPIRYVEQEWLGHSETRSCALEIAGEDPRTEWVLMLDAYTEARGELPPIEVLDLHDTFNVAVFEPVCRWRWFRGGHLMRVRRGFRWGGSSGLHENMIEPPDSRIGTWTKLTVVGSSSPKVSSGRTYAADAVTLEEHLHRAPDDARGMFYFAQSLKDAGNAMRVDDPARVLTYRRSFDAFDRRVSMGGFDEEVFWAMMWRAKLAPFIGEDPVPILLLTQARWHRRAEPLHELSWIARRAGEHDEAQRWGEAAWALPYPRTARLFVDCNAYSPDALEEAGIVMWPAPRDP